MDNITRFETLFTPRITTPVSTPNVLPTGGHSPAPVASMVRALLARKGECRGCGITHAIPAIGESCKGL